MEGYMVDKKKINVLFVLGSFGTGGSERVVLDLCKSFNREECEPYVVSLYGGELIDEFTKIGIWSKCLNKKDGIDFNLMYRLSRIIKEKDIDVINAHHFSPFIHSSFGSLINKKPLLYTDHTAYEVQQVAFFWRMAAIMVLKRCYGVIGISKGSSRQLKETFRVPDHKVFTILNAIDLERFRCRIDKEKKRQSLGIHGDEKVIGCIGNLREQKNHINLLKAFRIVLGRFPYVRLLIAGEGPMKEILLNLSRQLEIDDHVSFLGARLDAEELYQIMDVYCLSSHYEGLPLTILEAMASRVPVVGTDVIGINDIVIHGQTGLLVEPDNADKLAEAIIETLTSPQEAVRFVENAFQYVCSNHSIPAWVASYQKLFHQAASTWERK